MYSGEPELLLRRKTLAILHDEVRKVLDAARDLPVIWEAVLKGKYEVTQRANERIRRCEDEAEALRRVLTRELAEMGAMVMNREDLLRAAYNIEDIVGFISGIAFRLSHVRTKAFKVGNLAESLTNLVGMAVESVQKINEAVLALSINPDHAIDTANSMQTLERDVDNKYREVTAKILKEVDSPKDLIILKDIVERIENLADMSLHASDSVTILALGL